MIAGSFGPYAAKSARDHETGRAGHVSLGSWHLGGTSEDAYDHGIIGFERVGVPGLSKLVRVQVRELARTDRSVGLAIRWEATGPGGGLFPVLDADLTMAPA